MATIVRTQAGSGTYTFTEEEAAAYQGPRVRSLAGRHGFSSHTRVYGFSFDSQTEEDTQKPRTQYVSASPPAPDPGDPGGSKTVTEQEDPEDPKKSAANQKADGAIAKEKSTKNKKEKSHKVGFLKRFFRKLKRKEKKNNEPGVK